MANPTPVTYNAAASPIAGGRFLWPAWRREMTPRTWRAIPATNTLADLNPKNNPALNPNYPNNPEFMGAHSTIISAWCGAAWDDAKGTLWLPLQGGHADYGGNEPYRINIGSDAPTWEMLRPPTGAIGNAIITNDGLEATGIYADGRPRAVHSYNNNIYVPGVGPVVTTMAICWISGQSGSWKSWRVDEHTGEHILFGPEEIINSGWGNKGYPYSGAAYDSARHVVWLMTAGPAKIIKWDLALNTKTTMGPFDTHTGPGGKLMYAKSLDALILISATPSVWNPATVTKTVMNITGGSITLTGKTAADWCDELGCVVLWDTADRRRILTLTPTGDPHSMPWQLGEIELNPTNTLTPSSPHANGTYGRFFYSRRLSGVGILNATNEPVYFFALR